jgi:hypothetical protein
MPEAVTPYQGLDWRAVKRMDAPEAATMLDGALRSLDRIAKQLFIQRGLILLEVESRRLWEHLTDPETGAPYRSFEKWVVTAADYSRRDCFYALAAAKELRDIPVKELSQMPRCNIALMSQLSSQVRQRPEVIEAAKTLPEKAFVAKVQAEHPEQHLEARQPVVMASAEDCEEFEAAIRRAMELGAATRAEAIKDISVNYLLDHPAEEEMTA